MEINSKKNINIIMLEYDYGLIYLKCLDEEDNQYFDTDEFGYIDESVLFSKFAVDELYKLGDLYGEILNLEQNDPQNMVGFRTLQEVKYYFLYKLYVVTLLSSEYRQGKVLLYGFDDIYGNLKQVENLYTIEKYIKHLSILTDEDFKSWLRPDLQ